MNAKTRKPAKSGKSAQAAKAAVKPVQSTEPDAMPETGESSLARIHDLTSLCVISVPSELRAILGDEAYERNVRELEQYLITLIVREPHDVVYIHIPVLALEARPDDVALPAAVKAPARSRSKSKPDAKPVVRAAGFPASVPQEN